MYHEMISKAPLFQGVSKEQLESLLVDCPIHKLTKGQVLIAPGERNQYLYLVLSGILTIHLKRVDDPAIRIVHVGETVGELSLIGSTHTSAFVVSHEVTEVLIIDQNRFWHIIDTMPVIAKNLLHILSGWIVNSDKITVDHQQQIEELEGVAKIDGLTGIYNRRSFDDLLNRFIQRSIRDRHPLVLMMIDVDHFKQYNDTQGHLGGDQALIALAHTLEKTIRPGDFAARYGGEEFTIILPATRLEQGLEAAERVRLAVMNAPIAMPDGTPLPSITISMGLTESRLEGETEESILKRADAKLYQAKEEGRNRFCY